MLARSNASAAIFYFEAYAIATNNKQNYTLAKIFYAFSLVRDFHTFSDRLVRIRVGVMLGQQKSRLFAVAQASRRLQQQQPKSTYDS